MDAASTQLLTKFYQNLADEPLGPGDPRYVPIYETVGLHDPVKRLARAIRREKGRESARLLSGYRGSGKTTELRRLRAQLLSEGYKVILIDILDYLDPVTPLEISTFLLAFAGAFGEAMATDTFLGAPPVDQATYWERLARVLDEFKLEGLALAGINLKRKLQERSFRHELQDKLFAKTTELYDEVRTFVARCTDELGGSGVVVLIDSLEQIRGSTFLQSRSGLDASEVIESVARLFADHAERLCFPGLHMVYLVPPYIRALRPDIHGLYSREGLNVFPIIKVRTRDGERFEPGIEALIRVIEARGPWHHVFSLDQIERLIFMSGGHFRELLRLVSEALLQAEDLPRLPVDDALVTRAIEQIRRENLLIANDDIRALARIAGSKESELPDPTQLPRFAHFLDTNRVLCYDNGSEWFDVHPLIRDYVLTRAAALARAPAP